MRNNIGFYVGFSVFAIQTIAGDLYRDYKQQQHNNKIKRRLLDFNSTNRINSRLFISGSATTTRTTAPTKAQESTKH